MRNKRVEGSESADAAVAAVAAAAAVGNLGRDAVADSAPERPACGGGAGGVLSQVGTAATSHVILFAGWQDTADLIIVTSHPATRPTTRT